MENQTNNIKSKKLSCFIAIIVMKEELEGIVASEKYVIDEEFTNKHKEILICYKKEYSSSLTGYILTGATDPLYKVAPVGSEIAFLLTYLGVKAFSPDLILNIGYTGSSGLNLTYKRGDVLIAKKETCYYPRTCIIPFYAPHVKGAFPLKIDTSKIEKELGFIGGVVGSSDSFVASDGGMAMKMGIDVVEMELASINRVGYYLQTPVIALKVISDTTESSEKERKDEFNESLVDLGQKIRISFCSTVEYLSKQEDVFSVIY